MGIACRKWAIVTFKQRQWGNLDWSDHGFISNSDNISINHVQDCCLALQKRKRRTGVAMSRKAEVNGGDATVSWASCPYENPTKISSATALSLKTSVACHQSPNILCCIRIQHSAGNWYWRSMDPDVLPGNSWPGICVRLFALLVRAWEWGTTYKNWPNTGDHGTVEETFSVLSLPCCYCVLGSYIFIAFDWRNTRTNEALVPLDWGNWTLLLILIVASNNEKMLRCWWHELNSHFLGKLWALSTSHSVRISAAFPFFNAT